MSMIAAGLMAVVLSSNDGSASPPPAPETLATANAPASALTTRENQVICHRVLDTGSRLGGSKICRTRLEWDAMSRHSQEAVDAAQKRSLVYGPKPG